MIDKITNYPLDQLYIGQTAVYEKTCTQQDIALFAAASGDINPLHLDNHYAATTEFGQVIAHGMFTGALISAAIALKLPGPGSIYMGQSIKFKAPVFINDLISVSLEITKIRRGIVTLDCAVTKQTGQLVAAGEATVMAPKDKITIDKPVQPSFKPI